MDRLDDSTLASAALWYVEHGMAVFPVVARDKRPATKNGLRDWTDSPADVKKLWEMDPGYSIGIVCGEPSNGLLVLDIDVDPERGEDGLATLREWERVHGELPVTAVAVTGSGGLHYFYRTDRRLRPSVNPTLGIDIRAEGSYVVAPPSVHPNGKRYEWQDPPDEVPIAEADAGVLALVAHVQAGGRGDTEGAAYRRLETPAKIVQGQRNDALYRLALSLRSDCVPPDEIRERLAGANAVRCVPPLPMSEVLSIADSVVSRYPEGHSDDYCPDGRRVDTSALPDVGRPSALATADGCRLLEEAGPDPAASDQGDRAAAVAAGVFGRGDSIKTAKLGALIVERNRARRIDGAPAVWVVDHWDFGPDAISRLALAYADEAKVNDKREVQSYVMDRMPSVDSDAEFDGRHYVRFTNGVYCAETHGLIKQPDPSMLITGRIKAEWRPDIGANLADDFIKSVADNDNDTIRVLFEIIGCCICASRVISQSPMLVGRADGGLFRAANGKSTYLNFIRAICGPRNVTSMDIATLGQRFQSGIIVGKLANIGDDIPDGFLQGTELSIFKKLVTGDSIYSDVKNGKGFEFRPTATQIFSMNTVPRLSDTTDGIMRRLAFIPFRRKFLPGDDGCDPQMGRKLAKKDAVDRAALLGVHALERVIDQAALTRLPAMDAEIDAVRAENNNVVRWLTDECIDIDVDIIGHSTDEVYRRYQFWCDGAGERNPCSKRTVTERLGMFVKVTSVTSKMLTTKPTRVAGSRKLERFYAWSENDS